MVTELRITRHAPWWHIGHGKWVHEWTADYDAHRVWFRDMTDSPDLDPDIEQCALLAFARAIRRASD